MDYRNYKAGIDVGSTTAKVAVYNHADTLVYSEYIRHNARVKDALIEIFENIKTKLGEISLKVCFTGSAGMGLAERTELPFMQEVVASTKYLDAKFQGIRTLIDIGGEDSKMIFLSEGKMPDIRMNGSCAGGTGAFIDQMASLLNVPLEELDDLAKKSQHIYPIASRCGVFAKTDIQNLISRKIPKEDIAASIFHAVSIQTINTLSRGFAVQPRLLFTGGPLKFFSTLRNAFITNLQLKEEDVVFMENAELISAMGASLHEDDQLEAVSLNKLISKFEQSGVENEVKSYRLKPLFESEEEFTSWKENRIGARVVQMNLVDYIDDRCYLGIDSGSTTTKIVVTGINNEILFKFYHNNQGSPVETVRKGLLEFNEELKANNRKLRILQSVVTGYGEDLIKAAFGLDSGVVETVAHFTSAKFFNSKVSFIMDIGGQDMKAMFVKNDQISRIEINEACSSGCGSFIETFAVSLGHTREDFAILACSSRSPFNLGTRCTVFMNSKVKQALKENAPISDIAAGLSISVIRNALYKVLKLKDINELGDNIVVQGGTFKNPSVQRALENLTGKKVICPDIPEYMGAFGSALLAHTRFKETGITKDLSFEDLTTIHNYDTRISVCKGCENVCQITRYDFENKNVYYSGNKCEKIFSNRGESGKDGESIYEYKLSLLFDRVKSDVKTESITIGIPRVLNMYENFPFWHTLFTQCGINVKLSSQSTMPLFEQGLGTIMSDSICFPAKLAHGHILDLVKLGVDRIFFPMVVFEKNEFSDADNSFNCPIVSGYPDVIKSAVNTDEKYGIPLDAPVVNLNEESLLRKACYRYFKTLGVNKSTFVNAFVNAQKEQESFKENIKAKAITIIENAKAKNRVLIVLAGRPYHADPLINHKIPELLASLDVDVISEDVVPANVELNNPHIISQWAYPNRLYHAAQWVAEQKQKVQLIQINSFGCGPDAIVMDECAEILRARSKNSNLIRVDEITSTGSVRLRLRSMIESFKMNLEHYGEESFERPTTPIFEIEDKTRRTILAPYFSDLHSSYLQPIFALSGYKLLTLPKPDKKSVELGLQYANNEICYPATIIVGDVIKALQSGNYNHKEIAIGMTQTCGQCRATSYLSFIKKAMINAGFGDIPVIAVGTEGKSINNQPGFQINWKKVMGIAFVSTIYSDAMQRMYYSIIVREVNKGEAKALFDKYTELATKEIMNNSTKGIFKLLEEAVIEFNKIEINDGFYPRIGLVGEIYVKYNSFAQQNVANWLAEQGVEMCIPPIADFFMQTFVNIDSNKQNNLVKATFTDFFLKFTEMYANKLIRKANKIMDKYKFAANFHLIRDAAKEAEKIINLANQFGEGWLISAEITAFAEDKINNVISLQPFGCIANHVVSKGIEKRIKDLYPDMNLLYLDFDDGTSEVNILNRLHFMIKNVKEELTTPTI